MGASSSPEEAARAHEAAKWQSRRGAQEAEKRYFVALAQQCAEKRLQEEQRQKEDIEKWRRERHAEYEQRKIEELKMQQRFQTEQQQPVSTFPAANTGASARVRRTVPVQQKVSLASGAGKPSDTPSLATAAPPICSVEPSKPRASLDKKKVTVSKPPVLPEAKPKKSSPESYEARMDAANVQYEKWSIRDYVTKENALNKNTAATVMKLLDDNTVSFIARYRRGMTQGMEEEELRNIKKSYERAKLIKQRAESIIKAIDKQGKWTPQLHAFVHQSKSLRDIDRVASIFKVTKTNDADLGNIAAAIIENKKFVSLSRFVDPAIEGRKSVQQVKNGIVRILADTIKKDIRVYDIIKKLRSKYDIGVETDFAATNEPITLECRLDRQKYLSYDNFKSTDKLIADTDICNIRRGVVEKVLILKINVPPPLSQAFKARCLQLHIAAANASPLHKELINAAIDFMYDNWVRPSIENWTTQEIAEKAEVATMEIIVQHVKRLLLAPALRGKVVIGVFSPSLYFCKLAAVSERGDYLDSETIYPHNTDNSRAKRDAATQLVRMVKKYKCTTLAVGNGAACAENKTFILHLINKKSFLPFEVSLVVVDEAGLLQNFYSSNHADSSEFSTAAAVSIARRLQDPMAEFVKIEPKHLVEKIHQQDVPEKQLTATLNDVIVEAVSSVGVDLNTASAALLRRVAGLDEAKANSIVKRRESSGPFTNRADLKRVKGIGAKTFEQCAGFVRIMLETAVGKNGQPPSRDSFNYLDRTSIHPNFYDVAEAFLKAAKCNVDQLGTTSFLFDIRIFAAQGSAILAKKFGTSKDVIELIVNALTMERAPIIENRQRPSSAKM